MSRRLKVAISVFLGALAVLTAAAFSLNRSLWFLWAGLPAGDFRLAYDLQQPASKVLIPYLNAWLDPAIAPLFEHSARLAVSRSSDHIVAIALPRPAWSPLAQRVMTQQLRADGWQVSRLGLAVVASQGAHSPRLPTGHLVQSALPALRARLSAHLRHPLIIATVTTGAPSFLTPPFSLIAKSTTNELIIITTQGEKLPSLSADLQALRLITEGTAATDLSVSLPSELFSQLPPELISQWHTLLRQQFRFINTDPDLLIIAMKSQGAITIQLAGDHAALGVGTGSTQFTAAARAALQAEEAYLRPERRVFRLPDKTVGIELVPGQPRELFASKPPSTGCQQGLSLWLCQAGDRAALANDQTLAQAVVRAAPVHVRMAEKYARSLPLPLAALAAIATPEGNIVIQAKLVADKGVH